MQRMKSERDERPDNYTDPKRCEMVRVMEELFVGSCSRKLSDGLFSEEMTWYLMATTSQMRAQGRRKQRIRWTQRYEHGRASTCPSENLTRRSGETCRDELHHGANLASDEEWMCARSSRAPEFVPRFR